MINHYQRLPESLVRMLSVEAGSADEESDAQRLVQHSLAATTNLTFFGDSKAALRFYTGGLFAAAKSKLKHWTSKTFKNFLYVATNILIDLPAAIEQFLDTGFLFLANKHEKSTDVAGALAWAFYNIVSLSQEDVALLSLARVRQRTRTNARTGIENHRNQHKLDAPE